MNNLNGNFAHFQVSEVCCTLSEESCFLAPIFFSRYWSLNSSLASDDFIALALMGSRTHNPTLMDKGCFIYLTRGWLPSPLSSNSSNSKKGTCHHFFLVLFFIFSHHYWTSPWLETESLFFFLNKHWYICNIFSNHPF